MKGQIKKLGVAALALVLLIAGCATPAEDSGLNTPLNGILQSSNAGSVTIDVEWAGTGENSITFSVSMDTHSVELDSYNLGELTVLRDDAGNEYLPLSWDAVPGGHHRQGTLTFPLPPTLDQGTARYIEMVINDVAGIAQRVLTWQL